MEAVSMIRSVVAVEKAALLQQVRKQQADLAAGILIKETAAERCREAAQLRFEDNLKEWKLKEERDNELRQKEEAERQERRREWLQQQQQETERREEAVRPQLRPLNTTEVQPPNIEEMIAAIENQDERRQLRQMLAEVVIEVQETEEVFAKKEEELEADIRRDHELLDALRMDGWMCIHINIEEANLRVTL
eukprot:GHVU01031935.1.p1 GENE.GHVU01031935.1~~GHVU01031935.1.p1  ORF type:complete len:192 (+),score=62.14 GHVU01031935.1:221-796(+)